ncbi:MAG TPA: branched-chain amino acid ABC transporter permease [Polyangiaceae bacterium]|jgi:branched-chain amino acid transport system permease protein
MPEPGAGGLDATRRGAQLKTVGYVVAALVALVAIDFELSSLIADSSIRQLLMLAAIYIMVALSLNVINGMAGQFSIGHAGFVGVGAYTAAIVASNLQSTPDTGEGLAAFAHSWMIVVPSVGAGAIVAAFFGLVVGLPSLRLRGDYLAIVTLGFAEIFRLIIASAQVGATEGISKLIASLGGQNGYAGPGGQGVPLVAGPFWVFGAAAAMGVATWRMKFSGWGRALRALREDEIAAAAAGVDPTRYKVTSFVLSAAGAGIAGGLWATMRDGLGLVQPDQFNFQFSFDAITMVILGGSGSVTGAVLGALFVTFTVKFIELVQGFEIVKTLQADQPWLDLNALRMVIYAGVLITLMVLRPEGLLGERELFGMRASRNKAPPGPGANDDGLARAGAPKSAEPEVSA